MSERSKMASVREKMYWDTKSGSHIHKSKYFRLQRRTPERGRNNLLGEEKEKRPEYRKGKWGHFPTWQGKRKKNIEYMGCKREGERDYN